MGDEGSGYALVVAGLQAIAQAEDGRGPVTGLTGRFLERLKLTRPQELVGSVYRNLDRTALAALAPVVFEAADASDPIAAGIVAEGAGQLAAAVAAAASQLGLEGTPFPLALAGGVLLASADYRERVLAALTAKRLHAEPVTPVQEPAEGALRRALATV
jgi:N-acetylglucosamine kinase-like BadF-type ATPase